MYIAVARKQGVEPNKLRGTIQNDVLKEYIARGTYIFLRAIYAADYRCAQILSERNPSLETISISGYHIREAGSTAVQEVAFTLADAIAYVDAAIRAGLKVDEFATQISFFF